MSHIVTIIAQIRDPVAVAAACRRLQLPPPIDGRHQLFAAQADGLAVQLRDWRYPVVAHLATGELRYDNFQGRWGDSQRLDELRQAYAVEKATLEALPPSDALHKAGTILVMKVGGAAGPLYGSLLMGMGAALKEGADAAGVLDAGIAKVKARGKADAGAKTMLDVLIPVGEALKAGADPAKLRATAERARDATRDMVATRGRASFLGKRSKGHVDPGAASSCLLTLAVLDALGDAPGEPA